MRTEFKNQIFQVLLNHPLGIDNFKYIDGQTTVIQYKPAPRFQYSFIPNGSFFYFIGMAVNYSPNYKLDYRNKHGLHFNEQINDFKIWLDNEVKAYVEDGFDIDQWEEYKKRLETASITEDDYEELTEFTVQERTNLKMGLQELKGIISERFDATEDQLALVNRRLNYLTEAVDRSNKTDFKGILINTIISIMIALSLDTTRGQQLYDLFIQVLRFMPSLPGGM